jgi:hypothetical protein
MWERVARDAGAAVYQLHRGDAIASKPAPTFVLYGQQNSRSAQLRCNNPGNCATSFWLFNGARINPRWVPSGPINAKLPLWSTV